MKYGQAAHQRWMFGDIAKLNIAGAEELEKLWRVHDLWSQHQEPNPASRSCLLERKHVQALKLVLRY